MAIGPSVIAKFCREFANTTLTYVRAYRAAPPARRLVHHYHSPVTDDESSRVAEAQGGSIRSFGAAMVINLATKCNQNLFLQCTVHRPQSRIPSINSLNPRDSLIYMYPMLEFLGVYGEGYDHNACMYSMGFLDIWSREVLLTLSSSKEYLTYIMPEIKSESEVKEYVEYSLLPSPFSYRTRPIYPLQKKSPTAYTISQSHHQPPLS